MQPDFEIGPAPSKDTHNVGPSPFLKNKKMCVFSSLVNHIKINIYILRVVMPLFEKSRNRRHLVNIIEYYNFTILSKSLQQPERSFGDPKKTKCLQV